MKNGILRLLAVMVLLLSLGAAALAQEAVVPPSGEEVKALFEALGGLKGLGALGIVALVVQAVMLVLRSAIGGLLGKFRLVIVYGLSIVGGVLALHLSGVGIGAALLHANTLAALQVFANQIYRQFLVKAD